MPLNSSLPVIPYRFHTSQSPSHALPCRYHASQPLTSRSSLSLPRLSTTHCPLFRVAIPPLSLSLLALPCRCHASQLLTSRPSLSYGAILGQRPSYIRDILVPVSEMQGRTCLRSAAAGLYDVRFIRTQFGLRAFSLAAPSE